MERVSAVVAGMMMGLGCCWGSEPPRGCFRSIAEAAAQTHALDPANVGPESGGFRLEDLRRDRMLNRRWAMVRSCDHPERPATTVDLGKNDSDLPVVVAVNKAVQAPAYTAPLVRAGSVVRVVGSDGNLRFDTTGVAQSNGAMGETIRVRLVRTSDENDSAARVLTGRVRGAALLEWEP